MFIATMNSPYFEFVALGESADAARKALGFGLALHTAEYGLKPGWYAPEDVTVTECPLDGVLRDGRLMGGTA